MADESESIITEDYPEDIGTDIDIRKLQMEEDLNDPLTIAERVYHIWWNWADFHLYIVSPTFDIVFPPRIIPAEEIPGTDEFEFVYPIVDSGTKLSTSKSEEMFSAGMSMYKLYMTIEKMIDMLSTYFKMQNINMELEVQVAFGGHILAQRKAFESIINLPYNVVVTNFDPGEWGEHYLRIIKQNADKFGYPPEAPRDSYKKSRKSNTIKM